jgi:hypothetical protein
MWVIYGYEPGTNILRELGKYRREGDAKRYFPKCTRGYERCVIRWRFEREG